MMVLPLLSIWQQKGVMYQLANFLEEEIRYTYQEWITDGLRVEEIFKNEQKPETDNFRLDCLLL